MFLVNMNIAMTMMIIIDAIDDCDCKGHAQLDIYTHAAKIHNIQLHYATLYSIPSHSIS